MSPRAATHTFVRTRRLYQTRCSDAKEALWYDRRVIHGVRVVVVVPAYQEAPRIARVLETMPAFVDGIVVVDDASSDGTLERARAVADPRVSVVRHPRNRG